MDLIIPPPIGKLVDRQLVIVYVDAFADEVGPNTPRPGPLSPMIGPMSPQCQELVAEFRDSADFKVIKIANYALSSKSKVFCNLLDRCSSFNENGRNSVRIDVA